MQGGRVPHGIRDAALSDDEHRRLFDWTPARLACVDSDGHINFDALVNKSDIRVFMSQQPADGDTQRIWHKITGYAMNELRNFCSISETFGQRRARIRGMLSEYPASVTYSSRNWSRAIPSDVVNAIIPSWYEWLLDAYDNLNMFGFTVLGFHVDPAASSNVGTRGGHPIKYVRPTVLSARDVDVFVDDHRTELRYQFTNDMSRAVYRRAYILARTLPLPMADASDCTLTPQAQYDVRFNTPIANQLYVYKRFRNIMRFDASALAIATTRTFIAQTNPKAHEMQQSMYSASAQGQQMMAVMAPRTSTLADAVNAVQRTIAVASLSEVPRTVASVQPLSLIHI